MHSVRLSNTAWKGLIFALALLAAALMIDESYYSFQPLASGVFGVIHVPPGTRSDDNDAVRTISTLPTSPELMKLGAVVGDTVIFDDPVDARRYFRVGESAGVTLVHGSARHHVLLEATAAAISLVTYWGRIGDLASVIALFFCLLIAYKQPGAGAYRALTLYYLCQAFIFHSYFSPPGIMHRIADLMYYAMVSLMFYFVASFAVNYPADNPTGLRALLARAMPAFGAVGCCVSLYMLRYIFGYDTPLWYLIVTTYVGLGTIVTLLAFWDGWRTGTGMNQQRHAWLLMSIGSVTFVILLQLLPIDWQIGGISVLFMLYVAVALLSQTLVAYAVLKHRVFNFGFVVNRAIFYSATTLVLLIAFGIVEWLSEHLLHFEDRETNVFVDGAIAVGVYLTFHKIRHVFEHWLERIFFHKWHANDEKLREFINKAAHITTSDALLRDFQRELKRFSGSAHCTIYMRDLHGQHENYATFLSPADRIDVNDDICVSLRTVRMPVMVADRHLEHAGKLALPMANRGELHGFVLLGAKPSGEEYRPDEIESLGFATHQIGHDLHALRIERLEAEADALRKTSDLEALKIREQQNTIEHLLAAIAQIGGHAAQPTHQRLGLVDQDGQEAAAT